MSKTFIFMGMSDGVEGRIARPQAEPGKESDVTGQAAGRGRQAERAGVSSTRYRFSNDS